MGQSIYGKTRRAVPQMTLSFGDPCDFIDFAGINPSKSCAAILAGGVSRALLQFSYKLLEIFAALCPK